MNKASVSQWVLDKFVMAFNGLARRQQIEIIEGFCVCACDGEPVLWDYNMSQKWAENAWNYICVPCGIEDEFGSGTYKDELLKAVKEQFISDQQPSKDSDDFRDLVIDMFNDVKQEIDEENDE